MDPSGFFIRDPPPLPPTPDDPHQSAQTRTVTSRIDDPDQDPASLRGSQPHAHATGSTSSIKSRQDQYRLLRPEEEVEPESAGRWR